MYDEKIVDEVALATRSLAARSCVESVAEEFAGYINTLGIEIFLTKEATDRAVIELRNDLLAYLNQVLPEGNDKFGWDVSFWRNHIKIEVLFPWDNRREFADTLGNK